jgi:hypothetical protein
MLTASCSDDIANGLDQLPVQAAAVKKLPRVVITIYFDLGPRTA